MADNRTKDVLDYNIGKDMVDSWRYMERNLIPDRWGPIKYDAYEGILHSYLELMPKVAQRIDAIETFLEKGVAQGKAYVRPTERPDVGVGALAEVASAVKLLEQRISSLEAARKG